MSAKLFCDRCGREFEPHELYPVTHFSNLIGNLNWDLCIRCFNKLRFEFMPTPEYRPR